MDYSYYSTAQTPYQFLGFTPDSNGAQQNPQPNGFTSTPPPGQNQHFDPAFEAFDQNVYDPNNFVPPHFQNHRQSLQQSPAPSMSPSDSQQNEHRPSVSEPKIKTNNGIVGPNIASDPPGDDFLNRNRSSSEEKDSMTPAQSKRKAQNRAAQRAFRERKERRVKELEAKLNVLEVASTSLHDENERLKREFAKVATENEILRATSSSGPPMRSMRGGSHQFTRRPDEEIMETGPMKYTPTDFLTAIHINHSDNNHDDNKNHKEATHITLDSAPSTTTTNPHLISHTIPHPLLSPHGSFTPSAHRTTISPTTGQRLLSSGATWDFIQAHPLFKDGLVDIADVSERLKGHAECDGTGPAFEEGAVMEAIERSAAEGRDDELI